MTVLPVLEERDKTLVFVRGVKLKLARLMALSYGLEGPHQVLLWMVTHVDDHGVYLEYAKSFVLYPFVYLWHWDVRESFFYKELEKFALTSPSSLSDLFLVSHRLPNLLVLENDSKVVTIMRVRYLHHIPSSTSTPRKPYSSSLFRIPDAVDLSL